MSHVFLSTRSELRYRSWHRSEGTPRATTSSSDVLLRAGRALAGRERFASSGDWQRTWDLPTLFARLLPDRLGYASPKPSMIAALLFPAIHAQAKLDPPRAVFMLQEKPRDSGVLHLRRADLTFREIVRETSSEQLKGLTKGSYTLSLSPGGSRVLIHGESPTGEGLLAVFDSSTLATEEIRHFSSWPGYAQWQGEETVLTGSPPTKVVLAPSKAGKPATKGPKLNLYNIAEELNAWTLEPPGDASEFGGNNVSIGGPSPYCVVTKSGEDVFVLGRKKSQIMRQGQMIYRLRRLKKPELTCLGVVGSKAMMFVNRDIFAVASTTDRGPEFALFHVGVSKWGWNFDGLAFGLERD